MNSIMGFLLFFLGIIIGEIIVFLAVYPIIKDNNGYCPCRLLKNEDTKCMCKEFREQEEGECHCGLYVKIKEG